MARNHPFVGQETELARLQELYGDALAGRRTIGFVTGEPGAGKTALMDEFARRAAERDEELVVVRGNCNAQTGIGDPYLPFREVLGQLTGDVEQELEQGRMTEENASRLQRMARVSARALAESGPDLVGLLVPGGFLLARLGARVTEQFGWGRKLRELIEERPEGSARRSGLDQDHIFEQYTDVLRQVAEKRHLLLIVDDLQWADEASISLLFHLARRLGSAPIFVLGAYRPADVAFGRGGDRHPLEPVLNELRRYEGEVWVDLDECPKERRRDRFEKLVDLLPNRFEPSFRRELYRRTEGHPLFTLELLRHMVAEGYLVEDEEGRLAPRGEIEWDLLPARVEGVIGERLGRVDEELQEALRVASVEGERFEAQVVAEVLGRETRRLIHELGSELEKKHKLVRSEGLRRMGESRLAEYRFRHHLFQSYLYESLEKIERRYLHEEVGETLESLVEEGGAWPAHELARHFEAAGSVRKAVRYYEEAGRRALDLFANAEAIRHFRSAIDLLEEWPEGTERNQRELALRNWLGMTLMAVEGYSAEAAEETFRKALALCRTIGKKGEHLFPVIWGLWVFYLVRRDYSVARELGQQLLQLSEREKSPALEMEAHVAEGLNAYYAGGRFAAARDHFRLAAEIYDPERHGDHAVIYLQDPGVVAHAHLGWIELILGDPAAGRRAERKAVAYAREVEHPYSEGYACIWAAVAHQLRGEPEETRKWAEKGLAIGEEYGFPFWQADGSILLGWALAQEGEEDRGIGLIEEGIETWLGLGARIWHSQQLGILADAQLAAGRPVDAVETVDRALADADRGDEPYYVAELCRIRGAAIQAARSSPAGDPSGTRAARACLEEAQETAVRQGANLFELRAACGLARLHASRDRTERAARLLEPAVAPFPEEGTFPDLEEARELLEELTAP